MADPPTGRRTARREGGNASTGVRRRPRGFLLSDALRVLRAGGLAWVVLAAGAVAGVLLFVSELSRISYVTTITASCDDLADPRLRDSCLTIGHESHHWGFAILGLFVVLMAFGAAVGGSRPAAVALLVAGALCLAITLLHDLPNTSKRGHVGVAFADARSHKGTGFWLELIGSGLALGCGAFAVWRTPPPRAEGERRTPTAAAAAESPENPATT